MESHNEFIEREAALGRAEAARSDAARHEPAPSEELWILRTEVNVLKRSLRTLNEHPGIPVGLCGYDDCNGTVRQKYSGTPTCDVCRATALDGHLREIPMQQDGGPQPRLTELTNKFVKKVEEL